MSHIATAITALAVGFVLAFSLSLSIDDDRVERGWMLRKNTLYLVTPAKPVPAP